jgi:hypothetical protein
VAFVLLSGGLSVWFYRRTLPVVSPARRWTLSILRALSLSLLLLTLLAPVVRFVFTSNHPSTIAVLVDRSASMTISDRTGDRQEILREILSRKLPGIFPEGVRTLYYPFGSSLRGPFHEQDSLLPRRETADDLTDIATALQGIAREEERSTVRAAVILTDGVYTAGQNPLHAADNLTIPLFTVGIGDTAAQKDVLISHVVANEKVYAGTNVPADITVKSTGYGGARVNVSITEGSTVLATSPVTLPPGSAETPTRLFFPAVEPGTHHYTAKVSALPGELTPSNNTIRFSVRVLKSRLRIMMIAASPDPDVSILRQTLVEDKNLTVHARTVKSGGGFYGGSLSSSDLDSADCLVTIGIPAFSTPASTVTLVRQTINNRHMPVLFIAGNDLDAGRLEQMIPSIPVLPQYSAGQSGSLRSMEVTFVPDPAQRVNPIIAFGTEGTSAAWGRLPPIFKCKTSFHLREGSILLGSPMVGNTILPEPFMAMRSIAGDRCIAVLGHGIWRWRLMAQGNAETSDLLGSFLSSAIAWLSTREDERTVHVTPIKEQFSQGEPIVFDGQVYDATAHPVENASLRVTVTGNDQHLQTELRPMGNGRYQGNLSGLPGGTYAYTAEATAESTALGRDRGSFTVGGIDVEFLDTRMNAELLRQLATRTGGHFVTGSNVADLRDAFHRLATLGPTEERKTETLEVRQWPFLLLIIVALLAAEWVLRKRSGML